MRLCPWPRAIMSLASSLVSSTPPLIITPLGNFAFRRLPMGISCSVNSFQRFMHEVLQGIPNVFCFIDDLLIFSRNEKEHFRHLQLVFERLSQYGLILNRYKCIFKVSEIDFLENRISHKGVLPLVQKVEAIQNFPMPKTMRQLRKFLGMINFYRRFIPQAGAILHPLERHFSLRKNSKKSIPWSEESKVLMLLSPLDTFWQMLLV